ASTGQLHLELKGEAPSPATLQGTTPESGRFELASTEVQPGTRNFRFACHQLPLAVFSPWLPRLDPSLQLAGLATGECQFAMSATQVPPVIWTDVLTGNTSGKLSTTGMRVAAA